MCLRHLLYRPNKKIISTENDSYSYIEMIKININENNIFYAVNMDIFTIYEEFESKNIILLE